MSTNTRKHRRAKDRATKDEGKTAPQAMQLEGRATIQAAAGEQKQRRFTIVAYTGEPLRQEHMGWDYPVIVDMAGIDAGNGILPILDNHGPKWSNEEDMKDFVVGQSETAKVVGGDYVLTGPLFDQQPRAKEIIALADQGLAWQASIGARTVRDRVEFFRAGESVFVNGRSHDGPVYVSRKTELREVSFVVIGDDKNSSAVVASGASGVLMKTNITAKMTKGEYCKAKGFDYDGLNAAQKATMDAMYADFQASMTGDDDDDEDEDEEKDAKGAKARAKLDVRAQAKLDHEAAEKESRESDVKENKRKRELKAIATNPDLQGEILVNGETKAVVLLDHAITAGWAAEQLHPAYKLAELKAASLSNVRDDRPQSAPFGYVPGDPIAQGLKTDPHFHQKVIEAAVLQAGRCKLQSDSYYFDRGDKGVMTRRVPEDVQASAQLEYKTRYTDQVQQAAHTLHRGIGLWQVLAIAARSGGYRGSDIINDGNLPEILRCAFTPNIRADGGSLVSIQNTLANVMNKFLLTGYLGSDQSWRAICSTRPVKDFKPTKSIALTGDFVFKRLNDQGQITHGALTDVPFANQIDTLARMLSLNRPTIINDDLSAMTTVPTLMGEGGGDALNILVWTLWNNPGNGPDGNAFWFARNTAVNALGGGAHQSNVTTGALSSASLQAAVTVFDRQVKPNGQPLCKPPAILLYPPEVDVAALELMNSEYVVGPTSAKQPNKNVFQGRFKPVKSPFLSNSTYTGYSLTAWWLLCDPSRLAAIEVAFLNGQENPVVQTAQANFNELGIDIRGFFDPGAAMQDTRAGCRSTGV